MRIGLFTDSYRPYKSGVVYSIDIFKRELMASGHEVYIYAPNYPRCADENRVFRFLSVPAPTNPDFSLAIPFSPYLRESLRQIDPHLIHVHSPFLLGRLGARCARNMGLPLVFTFHTIYDKYVHYIPMVRGLTRKVTRMYYRDFCNGCDMVIAPTSVIADFIRNNGVTVPIEIIPTGIDLDNFKDRDTKWIHERFGLPEATRVLLCVGRLGKEKNLGFILDVFSAVAGEYPDTVLVLVGGGPEEAHLRRRSEDLGLKKRVFFTGSIDRKDVIHCYSSSYLFVFASLTETQGLVIAEAKAAGVPSVAIRAFGVSEMIANGEDGFLVGESRQEFVEKLVLILKDRDLHGRMEIACLKNVVSISSQSSAQKLMNCYENLIETKGGRRRGIV